MENNEMIRMTCIKERENISGGGKLGAYYLLKKNSIVEFNGGYYGEFYTMDKNYLGVYNLDRFVEMD